MATVLVGAYAQNPATTWPNLYSSCVWNFVTGWTCQTVEAPQAPPPQALPPAPPPPNNGGGLPVMNAGSPTTPGGGNGCCGCTGGAMPGAGVQAPVMSLAPVAGPTVAPKPCCGQCAPKGRGLVLVVALVAVVLVIRARLNA